MKGLFYTITLTIGLAVTAGEGRACRPLGPVEPMHQTFDAAAIATVIEVSGTPPQALVRFNATVRGALAAQEARLSLARGDCEPGGPPVASGQVIVVYFRRGGMVRWAPLDVAALVDPYVAAEVASTNATSRRQLRARAIEVDHYGGAVPLDAPETWMAPYVGNLGWTTASNFTRVHLRIDDAGAVVACAQHGTLPGPGRADEVCPRLRGRRFKPPLLPQEREAIYEVRWNERAAGR
jgi:hypothetical protein